MEGEQQQVVVKRKSENVNSKSKRPRNPRTVESLVASAWKSLSASNFNHTVTFCHSSFEATVRWRPIINTVELDCSVLQIGAVEIAPEVVTQLIGLLDGFVSAHPVYTRALFRVIGCFSEIAREALFISLKTVVFPESWVHMHSCKTTVFQCGYVDVQLEIRSVDTETQPPRVLQSAWHGNIRLSRNTATVLDLKDEIDAIRDKGIKFLREGAITGPPYEGNIPVVLPIHYSFRIIELRPYNYKTVTTFTEGTTEWMSPAKDGKLGCHPECVCHSYGTLRYVAYVVDESLLTPLM